MFRLPHLSYDVHQVRPLNFWIRIETILIVFWCWHIILRWRITPRIREIPSSDCCFVVDYGRDNYWTSADYINSYIQFDFMASSIILEGYTIKSNWLWKGMSEFGHMRKWKVEGSNLKKRMS